MVLAETGIRASGTVGEMVRMEIVWQPDVEMPIPFSSGNILMAALYARGYDVPEIADVLDNTPLYTRRLFHDARFTQSLPYKIAYAQGFLPESTAQSVLWMYKHKFLPPLPIPATPDPRYVDLFTIGQREAMAIFLSGYTRQTDMAAQAFLSPKTIRNYFSKGPQSIRADICAATEDHILFRHSLAAGFWMVEHGVIEQGVIGKQLP